MLLAIDVGNSNVTVGAFRGGELLNLWRLGTDPKKTADEYGASLKAVIASNGERAYAVSGVVFGSVVPALNPAFAEASRKYFGVDALEITPKSALGIKLRVEQPDEVGADRILNALAAVRLVGGPCVVIDFGTATTFDCISAKGEYLGGAILIGPKVAASALARYTAKLPEVDVVKPARVIGTNTVACIQAGLYHGYLGMLERVLADTLVEMGETRTRRVRVVATGGLAGLFRKDFKRVDRLMPDLTLQGLRLAYELLGPKGKTIGAYRG